MALNQNIFATLFPATRRRPELELPPLVQQNDPLHPDGQDASLKYGQLTPENDPLGVQQQPQQTAMGDGSVRPPLPTEEVSSDANILGPEYLQQPQAEETGGETPETMPSGSTEERGFGRRYDSSDLVGQLEQMYRMRDNPVNKDKGWKGLLRELAENFMYGMGQARPGSDAGQVLAMGGIGAGAGFLNKGWNERRAAERAIPELQQRIQFQDQQRMREAQAINAEAQPMLKKAELERKRAKDEITRKYNEDRIRLGEEKANDLRYWREQLFEMDANKEKGRNERADKDRQLVERRIAELERSNKAKEDIAIGQEQGRNRRHSQTQAAVTQRQAKALEVRAATAELQQALKDGDEEKKAEAQQKLKALLAN